MSEALPPWPGEFTGHKQMDCDLEARNTRARLAYWESRARLFHARLTSTASCRFVWNEDADELCAFLKAISPLPAAASRHGVMEPDDSPQAPLT